MKEFFIAGVQHHEAHTVQNDLEEGLELTMRPEPNNPYDPNAIALIYNADGEEDDTMLGYVPAKFSGEIVAILLTTDDVVCTLTQVDLKAKQWERYKVKIEEDK